MESRGADAADRSDYDPPVEGTEVSVVRLTHVPRSDQPDASRRAPAEPSAVRRPRPYVAPSGEPAERRADRIADEVVRRLAAIGGAERIEIPFDDRSGRIRRSTAGSAVGATVGPAGGVLDEVTTDEVAALRGGGRALPRGDRRMMESAFAADFGAVRIHVGRGADVVNRRIQSAAFTIGQNVVFRDGFPDTGSREGQHLLAHELAHTLQQRGASRIQRKSPTAGETTSAMTPIVAAGDTTLKKLRKGYLLSLREANVPQATYDNERAYLYDPNRTADEIKQRITAQAALQGLHQSDAAAGVAQTKPPLSTDEKAKLKTAVDDAVTTLTSIGNSNHGAATSDPVANIFPTDTAGARTVFTAAATGLRRLHTATEIHKVMGQPAPGLTSPAAMNLSDGVFAQLCTDPLAYGPLHTMLHESFHVVSADIQDRGGYRPDPGSDASVFLARPNDVKRRSAPHFEEVVGQYKGGAWGATRLANEGGALDATIGLMDAQDRFQGAWWASLDAVATMAADKGKAPTELALFWSLVEGLAAHRAVDVEARKVKAGRGARKYWPTSAYLTSPGEEGRKDARVTAVDYSLAQSVNNSLNKAYGMVKQWSPADATANAGILGTDTRAEVARKVVEAVLTRIGAIRKDRGRDTDMVNKLAGCKGYGPQSGINWQAETNAFLGQY